MAEKILTSKAALEGERKQVTVLFCDIVGSTAIAERLGAEAMHRLLSAFFEMALAEVHRFEGTVNQFLGDGFMALFGAPVAHEDHARRAVLAAVAIERAVREHAAAQPEGIELAIRTALNTGFVVVGAIGDNLRMDYTAIGDTTNLAARLQQLARPGSILVGETTARLVTGYVRLEALEPVLVKGKSEPVAVYRVEGLGRRRSPLDGMEERKLSPFVGRDREMTALRELVGKAMSGEGQVIGLVGEAGVGKSRLLLELRRELGERSVTYLEGRCLSFGASIPYLPIMDIVRNNCGIAETDSPQAAMARLAAALEEVGLDTGGAPYLLHLLGVREGTESLAALSPEAVKARTFEILLQLTRNGSLRRPLVMAVEDAHWIDHTSQELLEALADSAIGTPLVLLVTFRPGYRPPWVEKSYATQLALQRLTPADSLAVVRSVLASETVAASTAEPILQKAEGNPFFLEELARAVTEHGGLHAELAVPDTVHGVLMARIDRLPEGAKHTLQTASVLGREFSGRLLGALWDWPGPFEPHLIELKRSEFLYERVVGGEPVYVFKHALTQDVAYESLLGARRRELHAAAGRALEQLYADRLDEFLERIAHHYSRAAESEKAVEYLVRSAEKAARVYANADAVRALEEALGHVERLPAETRDRTLIGLVLRLAHSMYFLGRIGDTLELLLRHQERVERLADPRVAGPYYFWLGHTYSYLSDYERATSAAWRALQEAERCGDESTLGRAHYLIGRIGLGSGRLVEGIEHGRMAIRHLQHPGEWFWLGHAHWVIAMNAIPWGDFALAAEASRQARAIGEARADVRLQTYADWTLGWALTCTGEYAEAIAVIERSIARSRDALNTNIALGYLGHAHRERGAPREGIPFSEKAIATFRAIGYKLVLSMNEGYLAEALLDCGEVEAAREMATSGVQTGLAGQAIWPMAYNQRVLAQVAAAQGDMPLALELLRQAIENFAGMEARFEIARSRLDWAEVLSATGNPHEAVTQLMQARSAFQSLELPYHVDRTNRLAARLGLTLPQETPSPLAP